MEEHTVERAISLNFTLTTDEGDLDLRGEVTGLGGYVDIALRVIEIVTHGARMRRLQLDDLIRVKNLVNLEALR